MPGSRTVSGGCVGLCEEEGRNDKRRWRLQEVGSASSDEE